MLVYVCSYHGQVRYGFSHHQDAEKWLDFAIKAGCKDATITELEIDPDPKEDE